MRSWQEVLKGFKAERPEYDGAKACLVLMYLAVAGEEIPYRMAKNFKAGIVQENGWNADQIYYLRSLIDENQLRVLLREMEKKNLVVSRKEPRTPVTAYHYYRLDPWICVHGPGEPCALHANQIKEEFYLAVNFLYVDMVSDEYMRYFKIWRSIKVFDFITFLMFLRDEANTRNNAEMKRILERQIHNIEIGDSYEKWQIKKSERESRQIDWTVDSK